MSHPLMSADYIANQKHTEVKDAAVATAASGAATLYSKIFSGAGAPSAVAGSKAGDIYLRTSDRTAYVRTSHTTEEWKIISNA